VKGEVTQGDESRIETARSRSLSADDVKALLLCDQMRDVSYLFRRSNRVWALHARVERQTEGEATAVLADSRLLVGDLDGACAAARESIEISRQTRRANY